MHKNYKIVVYVPTAQADMIRTVMSEAGAGKIGNYSHCTFSTSGTGRFKPEAGARSAIGILGELSSVTEERIETVCSADKLPAVIKAIKDAHPYEEPAIDVYVLEFI